MLSTEENRFFLKHELYQEYSDLICVNIAEKSRRNFTRSS